MPSKKIPAPGLHVSIKSRKKILFEGDAYSVTSLNDRGFFDILPEHANFVSLIKECVVVDKNLPTEKTVQVEKGLISVSLNKVQVYLGL